MSTLNIRPATQADIPAIVELVNSAYRGDAARAGWTHEADIIKGELRTDEEDLASLISAEGATLLTCWDENKLLASVYLEQQGPSLYLGMLSVKPDLQGGGIGKQLLAAADAHALQLNCRSIRLTVINTRTELIAWYQRHGFRATGEQEPFHTEARFGTPVHPLNFLVMEKSLPGTN